MKNHKKRWEVEPLRPIAFLYSRNEERNYINYYFNKKYTEKYASLIFNTRMIEFNPLICISFNALNKEVKSLSNET